MVQLRRVSTSDVVYERVREAIDSGLIGPGEMIASTRELQTQLGVSQHAVIQGLSRLEQEGLILRKQGVGTIVQGQRENGDQLSPDASSLKVGVLMHHPLLRSQFMHPLLKSIETAAADHRANLVWRPAEIPAGTMLPRTNEEDVTIWVCQTASNIEAFPEHAQVVLVAHNCEWISHWPTGYDIVSADSRQGAALAGRHLRKIGCKRPVFLGVWDVEEHRWDAISRLRLEGFEMGWGERLPERQWLRAGMYRTAAGALAAKTFVSEDIRADAAFAASDELGMGLSHGLLAHGVKVGAEVKVMGFDAQPPYYPGEPSLTAVQIPFEALGRTAMRVALERAANPDLPAQRISLACTLRKGDTA